jgi:hypothetical protein
MPRDAVAHLVADVDALCAADPAGMADGETIRTLHQQLDRLTALITRATALFDAAGEWERDGARSPAAWVALQCHVPVSAARRRVRNGRALRAMPAAEQAWLSGEINEAHMEALATARSRVGGERFDPDESMLVDHARQLRFHHFLRALAYWEQAVDPDGVEDRAEAHRTSRRLHLSQSFDGMWFLDGVLDPIAGDIVARSLKAIEDELFRADWAEARARVGDGVRPSDLERRPGQRRADALVEMARRAHSSRSSGRRPEPLFTVLVGYETLKGRICELASGTVVTPGSLVPWLTEGWVERVVFDGPDRVKNVGTRRRIFSGATRRAVEVRDRECYAELCDAAADECEVDHIRPWAAGGATTDDNGRLACGYHNRRRVGVAIRSP